MWTPAAVDVVDHRRERGRLAGTGRTRDQHDPAMCVREVEDGLRKVEAFEWRNLGRNQTQHHPDRSTLLEHVDAITHAVGGAVGEVDVQVALEVRALPVVHHVDGELGDHLAGQRRDVSNRPQVTFNAEDRG
jgi:hypothetical protein